MLLSSGFLKVFLFPEIKWRDIIRELLAPPTPSPSLQLGQRAGIMGGCYPALLPPFQYRTEHGSSFEDQGSEGMSRARSPFHSPRTLVIIKVFFSCCLSM